MNAGWLSQAAIVGAGGFIGAVMRYGLSGWVHTIVRSQTFPWGSLAVNISGCLLIGLLGGIADSRNMFGPDLRLFLLLGVLGGFTTFSTFGYETLALARDADYLRAMLNVLSQVVVGLGAVWFGLVLAKAW